jgi:hypothetical protein
VKSRRRERKRRKNTRKGRSGGGNDRGTTTYISIQLNFGREEEQREERKELHSQGARESYR